MKRRTSEVILADALSELGGFVAELWPMSDGNPGANASADNFEILVHIMVDVLRAVPSVLRRHPELIDMEVGRSDAGLTMAVLGPDVLWITADGRTLARRAGKLETVRLDRADLCRRREVPLEFGSVDRERDAWPSCPTAIALLHTVAEGPLLDVVKRADLRAAEKIELALAVYERSSWLDAEVRKAIARRWRRETVVARLQARARTDVGGVYDLLMVESVMAS